MSRIWKALLFLLSFGVSAEVAAVPDFIVSERGRPPQTAIVVPEGSGESAKYASAENMDIGGARLSILLPFLMIDRYGDGLLEVLFGFKSPKEAFDTHAQK